MFLLTATVAQPVGEGVVGKSWVVAALKEKSDVELALELIPDDLRKHYLVTGHNLDFPFYVIVIRGGEVVRAVGAAVLREEFVNFRNVQKDVLPTVYRITEDYQAENIFQDTMIYDLPCVELDEEFYERRSVKLFLGLENKS
jgi:hypothetical protein